MISDGLLGTVHMPVDLERFSSQAALTSELDLREERFFHANREKRRAGEMGRVKTQGESPGPCVLRNSYDARLQAACRMRNRKSLASSFALE